MLDVLAEELRRLVPVRRAPGAVQERDVVGVANLLRRRAREVGKAHREHRGAQRVLERLSRAEVGRERKRADELGRADARRVVSHQQRNDPVTTPPVSCVTNVPQLRPFVSVTFA